MMGIIHYQPQLVGSQDLWKSTVLSGDWYIYICLTFSPIQLEAFGGIFFNDKCLRRMVWSPRFSPPHGEKKTFLGHKKSSKRSMRMVNKCSMERLAGQKLQTQGVASRTYDGEQWNCESLCFFLGQEPRCKWFEFQSNVNKASLVDSQHVFLNPRLGEKKSWKDLVMFVSGQTWIHGFEKKIGKNPSFLPPIALR